uniref:Immunoglobulin V-set domain-containing protein n=1 Tax=Anabas testudineus TaxID=64144 RepID=A0A3Q1HN26_ANATE
FQHVHVHIRCTACTCTCTSSSVGQTLTYGCSYSTSAPSITFICKGEDPSVCERLVSKILSTTSVSKSNGTFTLIKSNSGFNISISDVSSQDAGVYWCGGKSNDGNYRAGLRKIQLEVKGEYQTSTNILSIERTSITAPDPSVNKVTGDVHTSY